MGGVAERHEVAGEARLAVEAKRCMETTTRFGAMTTMDVDGPERFRFLHC
jgi:hypothetical protein